MSHLRRNKPMSVPSLRQRGGERGGERCRCEVDLSPPPPPRGMHGCLYLHLDSLVHMPVSLYSGHRGSSLSEEERGLALASEVTGPYVGYIFGEVEDEDDDGAEEAEDLESAGLFLSSCLPA